MRFCFLFLKNSINGRFLLWRKDQFGASTVSSLNCSVNPVNEKLGLVRRFFTVTGDRKGSISWAWLSNSKYLKVNTGIRRFISNDAPKREKGTCSLFFSFSEYICYEHTFVSNSVFLC